MTIQSLGVGSGLALDDLVQQLLQAERAPITISMDESLRSPILVKMTMFSLLRHQTLHYVARMISS
jgi:hypothetical protein